MRSIWRWSRAISSATPTPRRSGSSLNLASRSRSRSCSSCEPSRSVAMIEKRQKPADERAQLRARHDRVQMTEAAVRFCEAEVVRQLLARGLLNDTWAGERKQGPRLRNDDVTQAREACEDARGGRMHHDRDVRRASRAEIVHRAD